LSTLVEGPKIGAVGPTATSAWEPSVLPIRPLSPGGGLALFRHRSPGFVRIEQFHFLKQVKSFGSQVLFVNHAIMAHDEGLHSGDSIFGWRGHQREPSDHHAIDYKIHLGQRCSRTLAFQDFKKIPVVWLRTAGVALFDRAGNLFADRTIPGTIGVLPSESVL